MEGRLISLLGVLGEVMEIFKTRCGAQAGQESQDPQQARFHTAMPASRQAGCRSAGAVAQPRGADVKRSNLE